MFIMSWKVLFFFLYIYIFLILGLHCSLLPGFHFLYQVFIFFIIPK